MLNFQKQKSSFPGDRITRKILHGNSSISSRTSYFPQSLSEMLLWVRSKNLFSVIDPGRVWKLGLVISSGLCCTPSSEHTDGGCALLCPTLLLTSYIVLAVHFPLRLFSSCEIRFHWLTALVTLGTAGKVTSYPEELLHRNYGCLMFALRPRAHSKAHLEPFPCALLIGFLAVSAFMLFIKLVTKAW